MTAVSVTAAVIVLAAVHPVAAVLVAIGALLVRASRAAAATQEAPPGDGWAEGDYEALAEALPYPAFRYTRSTGTFEAMFANPRAELLLSVTRHARPDVLEHLADAARRAIETATLQSTRFALPRAGGEDEEAWEVRTTRAGADTAVSLLCPCAQDGSKASPADRTMTLTSTLSELREARDRLEIALDAAGLGVWDYYAPTGEVRFDDRFVRMLGYEPGELEGRFDTWYELTHPDDRDAAAEALQVHMSNGTPAFGAEFRMRTKQGVWKWVMSRGQVMERGRDGEPLLVAGVHLDVDEHRRAEETVERLAAFPRENPSFVLSADSESAIVYENPAAQQFLSEHCLPARSLFPPMFEDLVAQALHTNRLQVFEHEVDGHIIAWTAKPVLARDTVHIYGTDVTEQREAEAALERERANLERTVETRTHQLRESLRRLEDANRHKSQFISSMSHELRTPLNSILGFTDLLKQAYFGALNEKQEQYVAQIEESSKQLYALITDLLDIARVDAGRMDLHVQQFALQECVDSSLSLLKTHIERKGLRVTVDIAEGQALGDPQRCRQIVQNLLSNAVKFNRPEGAISIRCAREGTGIRFEVRDEGPGIAAEDQSEVFSEFYQSDAVRDAALGGTGIGLALTRRLVDMHGGRIGVVSEPGKGSTFWFTLPRRTASEPQSRDGAGDAVPAAVGRRILLVEDNEVNLALLLECLSGRHMDVALAHSGEEALDLARTFRPEAVLMDISLPGMDGIEATRRILELPECEETPVLALSADSDDDTVARCLSAGCEMHVAKPVACGDLLKVLDELFANGTEATV